MADLPCGPIPLRHSWQHFNPLHAADTTPGSNLHARVPPSTGRLRPLRPLHGAAEVVDRLVLRDGPPRPTHTSVQSPPLDGLRGTLRLRLAFSIYDLRTDLLSLSPSSSQHFLYQTSCVFSHRFHRYFSSLHAVSFLIWHDTGRK